MTHYRYQMIYILRLGGIPELSDGYFGISQDDLKLALQRTAGCTRGILACERLAETHDGSIGISIQSKRATIYLWRQE